MKKKLFSIFLLLMSLSVFSETIERDGVSFNLHFQDKTASVTAGTYYKYKGDVIIPTSVSVNGETYDVTVIEDAAFYGCNELKSIFISGSITYIGEGVFSGCDALTTIVVSKGNMVFDSRYDCNAIIETATNTLLAGCNNSTIPYSIQTINYRAFEGCTKLTKVTIPNSVVSLGGFAGCENLAKIEISNSVKSIWDSTFKGCKNLKKIVLPTGLKYIGNYLFENSGLQSISIPEGVTSIGSYAFHGCVDLESVEIPNSVTSIGTSAFEGCTKLTSIKIPNRVTDISDFAFSGCI